MREREVTFDVICHVFFGCEVAFQSWARNAITKTKLFFLFKEWDSASTNLIFVFLVFVVLHIYFRVLELVTCVMLSIISPKGQGAWGLRGREQEEKPQKDNQK